jgi:hypothetical protein
MAGARAAEDYATRPTRVMGRDGPNGQPTVSGMGQARTRSTERRHGAAQRHPDRGFTLAEPLVASARRALILTTSVDADTPKPPKPPSEDALVQDARALLARFGWRDEADGEGHAHVLSPREVRALAWAANTAILRSVTTLAAPPLAGDGARSGAPDRALMRLLDALIELGDSTGPRLACPPGMPVRGRRPASEEPSA